jgi:hypothetical protein
MFYYILTICLLKLISSETTEVNPAWILPDHFSILSTEKIGFAKEYKNLLVYLIELSKKTYKNQSDSSYFSYLSSCEKGVEQTFNNNTIFLYDLFLASDIFSDHRNLGKFDICESFNDYDLSKFKSKFIHFSLDSSLPNEQRLKLQMSLCLPFECNNFLNYLYNVSNIISKDPSKKILYQGISFKLHVLPLNIQYNFNDNLYISSGFIMISYFCVLIALNIVFAFLYTRNPYEKENEENKENKEKINFLISQAKINNEAQEFIKYNCLSKTYNSYFSLYNLSFILFTTKTKIFNDQKLKFLNGFIVLFMLLNMASCSYLIVYRYAQINNQTQDSTKIENLLAVTFCGVLFTENYLTISAFIMIYKILNVIKDLKNRSETRSVFILIFRQIDKVFVFFILNFMVINFLEEYVSLYFNSNVNWIIDKKRFTDCSITSILPMPYSSYSQDNQDRCYNGHSYFFHIFYSFFFTFFIIKIMFSTKSKLKFLISLLIFSLSMRILYTIYFFKYMDEDSSKKSKSTSLSILLLIYFYQDITQNYIFFHLPNSILGLIGGYIYFNYKSRPRESFNDMPTLDGMIKLEMILENKYTKNISFLASIFILFMFCGMQLFISRFFDRSYKMSIDYSIFIISSLGFISCLCLFFIILCVKLKEGHKWSINKVLILFLKRLFCNSFILMISRLSFTTIIIHKAIAVFFIFNLESAYVYLNLYSVFNLYGIPLMIITLLIAFVLTLTINTPIRILTKNLLSLNNY